jgi:hypothetical protein
MDNHQKGYNVTRSLLKYFLLVFGLVFCTCTAAYGLVFRKTPHPEIDPSLAVSALTLLAGSLAVLRSRRIRDNHRECKAGKSGTFRNARVHF